MLALIFAVIGFSYANSADIRVSTSLRTLVSPNCDAPFDAGLQLFCCKNNLVPEGYIRDAICNGKKVKDVNIIHMDIAQNHHWHRHHMCFQ